MAHMHDIVGPAVGQEGIEDLLEGEDQLFLAGEQVNRDDQTGEHIVDAGGCTHGEAHQSGEQGVEHLADPGEQVLPVGIEQVDYLAVQLELDSDPGNQGGDQVEVGIHIAAEALDGGDQLRNHRADKQAGDKEEQEVDTEDREDPGDRADLLFRKAGLFQQRGYRVGCGSSGKGG